MNKDPKYTVVIRGEQFTLTKSQIEFDSPNYFTSCFLGEFLEAQTHQLELSRDPELFRIVIDYLCGYRVLPLGEGGIPKRMSPETALQNLRADAAFYLLEGLVKACDALIEPKSNPSAYISRYLVLGYQQISSALNNQTGHWFTYISQSQMKQGPLATLERPEAYVDYQDSIRLHKSNDTCA